MFCNDDELAAAFEQAARDEDDPLWRLPLWQPYRRFLDSKTADINNAGDTPFAGSITAALFLREFVGTDVPWRSEEHTSELQSLMRISYAVFCLKKKKYTKLNNTRAIPTLDTNKRISHNI